MCESPLKSPGERAANGDQKRRLDATTIVCFVVTLVLLYLVNFVCVGILIADAFEADFGQLAVICRAIIRPCEMLGDGLFGILVVPPIEAALITGLISALRRLATFRVEKVAGDNQDN